VLVAPRFDHPILVALNVVGLAVFVYAVVRWVGATRAGRRPRWLDLLLLLHVSLAGVYLPIMPLVWLRELGEGDRRVTPAAAERRLGD